MIRLAAGKPACTLQIAKVAPSRAMIRTYLITKRVNKLTPQHCGLLLPPLGEAFSNNSQTLKLSIMNRDWHEDSS